MATTVNAAFKEFMKDIVNLDPDVVSAARISRDNLLDNIAEFDEKDGFFDLYEGFNAVSYTHLTHAYCAALSSDAACMESA